MIGCSGAARASRLDAESFRDATLAAGGRLDLTMGGPGVQNFKLGKPIQLTPTVDYAPFDWNSPGAGRRSIYRFVYRGLPDPFMEALDFPDAAQLAPTRPLFSVAAPVLTLWNSDFVLQHCAPFAARLEKLYPTCRRAGAGRHSPDASSGSLKRKSAPSWRAMRPSTGSRPCAGFC